MSVIEIIKLGRKYLELWPNKKELLYYFSEYRSIQVARFVCRVFPYLAILTFMVQLYLGSLQLLPQALVYLLFILSMPLQALVMLGVKADKYLPQSLAQWYKEGVAKINEQGGDINLSVSKPRYIELAYLLNITYKK